MTRRAGRPDPSDSHAAAAYIGELSGSLAAIARGYRLDTLSYILEMAREEAETILRTGNGTRREQ
jgi:hypothetical protein